jgi:hypothetical protein
MVQVKRFRRIGRGLCHRLWQVAEPPEELQIVRQITLSMHVTKK